MAKKSKKQKQLLKRASFSGRRTLVFVLAFAIVGAAVALAITKAANNPFRWTGKTVDLAFNTCCIQLQNPVEQWTPWNETGTGHTDDQTKWVYNKTGCTWDVDDMWGRTGNSNASIRAGATITDRMCDIADCDGGQCAPYRYVYYKVDSPNPNLNVSLSFSPGKSFNGPAPVYLSAYKVYEYTLCVLPPVYPYNDPALQPIPDSNGGYGVHTDITLSINNPNSTKANVKAEWEISNENYRNYTLPPGCISSS